MIWSRWREGTTTCRFLLKTRNTHRRNRHTFPLNLQRMEACKLSHKKSGKTFAHRKIRCWTFRLQLLCRRMTARFSTTSPCWSDTCFYDVIFPYQADNDDIDVMQLPQQIID